jgi:hypothetical protein
MSNHAINVLQNEAEDGPAPQETPERYVYAVPSDTSPKTKYRVDLLANNGAGFCSCTDFATRRQVNLDAGQCTLMVSTTCKHLRRTIRHFNRRLFAALSAEESRPLNAR